jgi:hypothetical protein
VEEVEFVQAVVDYLEQHPHAMDTLEGIAQWWIPRRGVRVEVSQLARAVDRLTSQGILEQMGSGRNALYRLKT